MVTICNDYTIVYIFCKLNIIVKAISIFCKYNYHEVNSIKLITVFQQIQLWPH